MKLDGHWSGGMPDQGLAAAQISREIVQLNARLHGRGPIKARTFINREYALCVLESVFTTAERTLIAAGKPEAVECSRNAFNSTAIPEMCRIVEEATGRSIRGCTSAIDVALDAATNVFLFAPEN